MTTTRDGLPILDAYRTEYGRLAVWCEHEHVWHWHGGGRGPGDGDGHRGAHCGCPQSPHRTGGYVLREVGPLTPAVRRAHRANRGLACPTCRGQR